MSKELRSLILKYSYVKEKEQTHTFFGENRIKKLSVPEEERDDFYRAYVSYCCRATNDLLQSKGLNSITEKAKGVTKFFVDMDLKFDDFQEGLIELSRVPQLIRDTCDTFVRVLSEALESPKEETSSSDRLAYITAFRGPYKCHLYFPNVYFTSNQSQQLVKDVESRMLEKYPWLKEKAFLDTSVYRTGLRLLFSHKGKMVSKVNREDKPSEETQHTAMFPDVPYEHYYRIGVLDEQGNISYRNQITFEDVKATSILTSPEDDPLPFCAGYLAHISQSSSFFAGGKRVAAVKSPNDTEGNVVKHSPPSHSLAEAEMQDDSVSPRLSFLVREYLQEHLPQFGMSARAPMAIKMNEYGNVMVVLAPQACPIVGRMHRRTELRKIPANYVVMNAFQCSLRCFDDCCTEKVNLPTPDDELLELFRDQCKDYLLKRSLYRQTDETVSQYIFSVMKDRFAASPSANSTYVWYHYEKHKWVKQEKIMTEIMSEIGSLQKSYRNYVDRIQKDPGLSEEDKKATKTLWLQLETNLQMTKYVRPGILPLLARKLDHYWSAMAGPRYKNFQSRLDDDPMLLGCKNGVWDLAKGVFRPGCPTDFISMSTNVDYIPWDQCDQELKAQLDTFLTQIFLREDHKRYVMKEMAKSLNGTQAEQRFFLFTGGGANGKSTLIKLFDYSFGEYVTKVSIAKFTRPLPPSNVPQSDTIALKGTRFVYCEEPNAKEPLNLGTIKAMTGGDKMTANDKFEKQQTFYLQATFVCSTNDIPPINASVKDYGTWRRLKPVVFCARFVENPNPDRPNEFKTDDNMEKKLKSWTEVFLSYILNVYLNRELVPVPDEFRSLWNELQNKNDLYSRFTDEYVVASDAFRDGMEIWEAFKTWAKTLGVGKDIRYDTFEKNMVYQLGNLVVSDDGKKGWNVELKPVPTVY